MHATSATKPMACQFQKGRTPVVSGSHRFLTFLSDQAPELRDAFFDFLFRDRDERQAQRVVLRLVGEEGCAWNESDILLNGLFQQRGAVDALWQFDPDEHATLRLIPGDALWKVLLHRVQHDATL